MKPDYLSLLLKIFAVICLILTEGIISSYLSKSGDNFLKKFNI